MRAHALVRSRELLLPLAVLLFLDTAQAQSGKVPTQLRAQAQREGRVRVIAELATSITAEGDLGEPAAIGRQRRRIASAQRGLARGLAGPGTRVVRAFATVPFVALEVDPAALDELERSPLVASVEFDSLEHAVLTESIPLVQGDLAHAAGLDGDGTAVAVLDTGVDAEHELLAGRVVEEACFSSTGDCPNGETSQFGVGAAAPCTWASLTCPHGTHVAGIVAANGATLAGVAPSADLIAIQVFSRFSGALCAGAGEDPCAASFASDQVAGLEHVLALRAAFPIAAANLSLAGSQHFASQALCDASNRVRKAVLDHLRSVGIATTVAAGNDGSVNGLGSPACISSAVSVGATTLGDAIATFSNSAPYLSLLAPGVGVQSARAGGGTVVMSGTSMAAPHVAGAFALLYQQSPSGSMHERLDRLQQAGLPLVDQRTGLATPRIRIFDSLGLEPITTLGVFENPPDGGVISGIHAFSAWLCNGRNVAFRVDDGIPLEAAYGTRRDDTKIVCGDTDNGAALLFNFNLLGDGEHVAELLVDGAMLARSTFTVATLGTPFLRGAPARTYVLQDFDDKDVVVQWSQSAQGFMIVGYE